MISCQECEKLLEKLEKFLRLSAEDHEVLIEHLEHCDSLIHYGCSGYNPSLEELTALTGKSAKEIKEVLKIDRKTWVLFLKIFQRLIKRDKKNIINLEDKEWNFYIEETSGIITKWKNLPQSKIS